MAPVYIPPGIQTGKQEVKFCLFIANIIYPLTSSAENSHIDTFRKVAGYKININIRNFFLYVNKEHAEKEIKEIKSILIALKILGARR